VHEATRHFGNKIKLTCLLVRCKAFQFSGADAPA
jgi:hypothetical protein